MTWLWTFLSEILVENDDMGSFENYLHNSAIGVKGLANLKRAPQKEKGYFWHKSNWSIIICVQPGFLEICGKDKTLCKIKK